MSELKDPHPSGIETAAFALIGTAMFCVVLFNRHFVKFKIGPIYALEAIALLWAAAALPRARASGFLRALIPSLRGKTPALLFALLIFAYGAARLAVDLAFQWHGDPPAARVLQHCLTFVYPLAWMTIGAWCAFRFPNRFYRIGLAVLAASIPSFLFFSYSNLKSDPLALGLGANYAIGPLAALAAAYLFSASELSAKKRWAFGLFFAVCAFFPFWKMVHSQVQRTSLMLLLFMVGFGPWIASTGNRLRALGVTLGLLTFLGTGTAASLMLTPNSPPSLVESLRHDDDRPARANDENKTFQFKSRSFWWKTALEDWHAHLVFGVGTLAEVPSSVSPGIVNDGHFEGHDELASLGGNPIAGPHNSYLGVLARFGVVGLLLFAGLTVCVLAPVLELIRNNPRIGRKPLEELAWMVALFIPMNGLAYAMIGVGFESPYNCVLTWFYAGVLLRKSYK